MKAPEDMTPKPLPLTHLGTIPRNRNAVFYRVETWKGGHFVADFATQSEAQEFAILNAKAQGCCYDHKVSRMIVTSVNRR